MRRHNLRRVVFHGLCPLRTKEIPEPVPGRRSGGCREDCLPVAFRRVLQRLGASTCRFVCVPCRSTGFGVLLPRLSVAWATYGPFKVKNGTGLSTGTTGLSLFFGIFTGPNDTVRLLGPLALNERCLRTLIAGTGA